MSEENNSKKKVYAKVKPFYREITHFIIEDHRSEFKNANLDFFDKQTLSDRLKISRQTLAAWDYPKTAKQAFKLDNFNALCEAGNLNAFELIDSTIKKHYLN